VTTRTRLASLLLAAILVKLIFIWHLGGRVYPDVSRALTFGYAIDQEILSIHEDFIRNKTFVGPVLWFELYERSGIRGLMVLNMLAFGLLFVTQYRLGRTRYGERTILIALFLVAFYVGTNRNVVAGEADDNVAALLVAVGLLVYLDARRPFAASLLTGLGFLFKYWVAVFVAGFALYLLTRKRWRELLVVTAGALLPFLFVNGVDGFQSLRGLLGSAGIQHGYSDWGSVGFKMIATGMAPSALVSAWVWLRHRSEENTLFFFVSSAYVIYVLAQRDAHATSYVMMLCLVFSSFLLAEFLSRTIASARGLAAICAVYLCLSSAITYFNLYQDTNPVAVITDPSRIDGMFP
jgi:hypothetical protein